MAELLSFLEGTAQIGAGGLTTQVYVRDVQISPQRRTFRYRAPFSTTYTHVNLQDTPCTLTMTVADSPHATGLKALLYAGAIGTMQVHVFAKTPGLNTSGGWYGYSGTLDAGSFQSTPGQVEQSVQVQGWFATWTAY
jgi:hypothetical protein